MQALVTTPILGPLASSNQSSAFAQRPNKALLRCSAKDSEGSLHSLSSALNEARKPMQNDDYQIVRDMSFIFRCTTSIVVPTAVLAGAKYER